ncbi:peroxiredoxin Q/BCP [Actinokineospora alba]|uniref:thioredoxin-dependent peroxiredoxin n=1 Tax=Actinokineospora alba TaxID=504798 RepID=A0A1H0UZS4_9PSEU|nr:peroxiredoxin [Actinokineospora alba]TDP68955.1 peroxiredoxin Q/BCP [Actinokineospora alba]SDI76067.1 peroxiredoxin Q/BCP [Actinokineospora alba]SDP71700.1 peroxiredoxin Q/BCP [Actinokineospora alba]
MRPGDLVPDFKLEDETGAERALSEFLETGPVVLFFYPAAMTSGCTAESCHFRDLAAEFAEVGAHRIGISPDSVDRQAKFSSIHSFDYPLLSDPDGEVATLFGVRRKFGPLLTKRMTFVIDTDSKVLEAIKSELRMSVHADKALEALRARKP